MCASSLQGGNLSCTVDHDLNGVLFQSDEQAFSWVIFDFQECSVRPNYYTIAHRSAVYAFFMRSWQLEGVLQVSLLSVACHAISCYLYLDVGILKLFPFKCVFMS